METMAKMATAKQDQRSVHVIAAERPFGMNVQATADQVPRVMEVLPGYPAEKAGVKKGFVLKSINGKVVNGSSWIKIWETCKLPCGLTFDPTEATTATTRATPKMVDDKTEKDALRNQMLSLRHSPAYRTVRIKVTKQPFGMHIATDEKNMPVVNSVIRGTAAHKAGVQEGDVLLEVAGVKVDS